MIDPGIEIRIRLTSLLSGLALLLSATIALGDALTGVVDWERRLELGPLVGGTVLAADAEVGDRVDKGGELMRIDPLPYQQQAIIAEARVAALKTEYDSAKADYQRQQELYDIGSLSTVSLQESSYALSRAESAYARAQARLELARHDLAKTSLQAPFDVWVIDKRAFAGQNLSTSQMIPVSYVVTPIGRYIVEVQTAGGMDTLPPIGSSVKIEAAGKRYDGNISFPREVMGAAVGRLTARFEDKDRLLLPGTQAVVIIGE